MMAVVRSWRGRALTEANRAAPGRAVASRRTALSKPADPAPGQGRGQPLKAAVFFARTGPR